jgi:hypothetical protein
MLEEVFIIPFGSLIRDVAGKLAMVPIFTFGKTGGFLTKMSLKLCLKTLTTKILGWLRI